MKIKNIKINNFGNLENKEINFNDKINIIYGKNESGKSTLLNYIKCIFYGISKNKNGKEISDYERYKPWMKDEFSGKLKYELDDGETFEIFRDFNKKNPKIYDENLEEISKEFGMDKKEGSQFFYEQTNLDESMFLSTIVSIQQEVKLNKQEQDILIQKIANLAGTGDDTISFKKMIDKLNKKQVDEIGTDRTQEKPINLINKKMKELALNLKEMKALQDRKQDIQEEKIRKIEKIKKLECEYHILMKVNELDIERNIEEEKIHLKTTIKDSNKEKANKLKLEKDKLLENINVLNAKNNIEENINKTSTNEKLKMKHKQEKNRMIKYYIPFIIGILIAISLKIGSSYYIKSSKMDYLVYGIAIITFIFSTTRYILNRFQIQKREQENELKEELRKQELKLQEEKNKNEQALLKNQIENIKIQINDLNHEIEKQEREIKEIQTNIDYKIDMTIENIRKENQSRETEAILEKLDLRNTKVQLSYVQEEIHKEKILLNTLENNEQTILEKLDNMIELKEQYDCLEDELKQLEEKSQYIQLTKEYFNKAYEKMKNTVTPKFTENLSKNISDISNQKYNKVTINDEEGIIVENQFGEYISANRLSIGTIDQLYLSLRLSMLDEISNENMPIILDEAFAYYDDTRLKNILEFFITRVNKNQIIILTCTKREQEILDKIGFEYNLVEL